MAASGAWCAAFDALIAGGSFAERSGAQHRPVAPGVAQQRGEAIDVAMVNVMEPSLLAAHAIRRPV
ncbi:MAG: hypothetical protein ACRDTE_26800 [Pseudonocardiaceae bacterium]